MARRLLLLWAMARLTLLCCLLVAACGAADAASDAVEDLGASPSPFTMQFVGTYQGAGARLELRRDGTFTLTRAGASGEGRFWTARSRRLLPLELLFTGSVARWRGTIGAYDGKLETPDETLQLSRPPQADEELCDATAGRWTDDDPDPATGLYCVCPNGTWFIPAGGGCVP